MKKSLLLLASLMMAIASFAQWTKPVPKHVDEYKFSTMAAEGAGDTIAYYLYNKDAGAFFTEGNDYGTRASIGSQGLKVAISKYIVTDESGATTEWDGKSVIINDFSIVKKAWKELFLDGSGTPYVDRNGNADYMWEITPTSGGYYRIGVAAINPKYNQSHFGGETYAYFGYDSNTKATEGTTLAVDIDINDDVEAAVDWCFVSEEAYTTYLEDIIRYEAAVELKKALDKAVNYNVDTSDAQKVYDNTASTLEQLTAATSAVNGAIAEKAFMDATETNPYDATEWIINPNFDDKTIKGWDTTFKEGTNAAEVGFQNNASFSNGEASLNGFMQAWDGANAWNPNVSHRALGVGQLSQTIANMPQGKYKFTVDAIACYEPSQAIEDAKGVQLFATGGSLDIYQEISTARQPEHYEIVFVNSGGDITMGVRTTDECSVTWIALDNFTLTYYGPTEEDPYKLALDAAVKSALDAHPVDALDDVIACAADKEAYKKAIGEAQKATSEYEAKNEALKNAVSALESSINAYAEYVESLNTIREFVIDTEITTPEGEILTDYVGNDIEPGDMFANGSAEFILHELKLTADEIATELEVLNTLYSAARGSIVTEGSDITYLLANPSYDDGTMKGWSYDTEYSNGQAKPAGTADGWYNNFNVYQTLTGVPNGVYKLNVQAFYREEQNSTSSYEHYIADPAAYVSPAFIYINNAEKPVNSIASRTFTQGELEGGFESVAEGVYLPSNDAGVKSVFDQGYYDNEIIALVTDHTLKVGIKSLTASGGGRWVAWDNFRLVYIGSSDEALSSVVKDKIEAINEYITSHEELTEPAIAEAQGTINAANEAKGDELFNAISNLDNAITPLQVNVAAVEALIEVCGDLSNLIENNPSAEEAAQPLLTEMEAYTSLTTPEVVALTEKIRLGIRPIALSVATPDNPTDISRLFIVNPNIDGNDDGWTCEFVSGETATDVGYQGNSSYTNEVDEVTISQFLQAWGEEEVLGNASIYQVISGLPSGTYKLTADIIAADQLSEEPTAVTGAYLSVQERDLEAQYTEVATEDGKPQTFELIFTKANNDTEIAIGVMTTNTTANWIAADNFKLYCLGTDPTAISNVSLDASSVSAIYTVSGARINTCQKGVNIVKSADGKVSKIMVK